MRPVDKGSAPPSYQQCVPATLSFTGKYAADAYAVFNTATPSLDDCLREWTDELDNPHGGARGRIVLAIGDRISKIYKSAASRLADRIGDYCSYCETWLSGDIEVEHVLAKSQFPVFAVDWENFLLACSACNTQKGSDPLRLTIQQHVQTRNPQPTEQDFYDEMRYGQYDWPDLNPHGLLEWPVEFRADLGGGMTSLPIADAVHPNNVLRSSNIAQKRVTADLWVNGQMHLDCEVMVLVNGATPRAERTRDLVNLNRTGHGSPSDRRLFHRTVAWFSILLDVAGLLTPVQPVPQQNWAMLYSHARTLGHYSLWVTILSAVDPMYARRFVNETVANGTYPGSNCCCWP